LKEFKELIKTGSTYDKEKKGKWFGSDSNLLEKSEKSIFMPAAGGRIYSDCSVYGTGNYGYYWSSAVNGDYGRSMDFNSSGVGAGYYTNRTFGMSVRCVAEF
jgi:uncharacterized protein (TIGR02145 family)